MFKTKTLLKLEDHPDFCQKRNLTLYDLPTKKITLLYFLSRMFMLFRAGTSFYSLNFDDYNNLGYIS